MLFAVLPRTEQDAIMHVDGAFRIVVTKAA